MVEGLKPPLAQPEPRKLASICVDWPNRGAVQGVVGVAEVRVVEDVEARLGKPERVFHDSIPGENG